jgi:hypothetical protein
MQTQQKNILTFMKVLFWIIFIGLCIKTGAIIISVFVSLFVNDIASRDLYEGLDLSAVKAFSDLQYYQMVTLLITVNALKAYMAFLVVKIFQRFNLASPFNEMASKHLSLISFTALSTAVISFIANAQARWLLKRGVAIDLHWGYEELLFFAGVMYIIAHVFQKGNELQSENELTV